MPDKPLDAFEALKQDKDYQAGIQAYKELELKAHEESNKIAQQLVEQIVKKVDKFNLSTAILTAAKTLTHLASFLYDTEEEFLSEVQKARRAVVTDVIPALLDPTPCGKCEACKNGRPNECLNPDVREDYTESRFLPLVANMMLEYDMFNKIIHMYLFKEEQEAEGKEEEKKDGNEQ